MKRLLLLFLCACTGRSRDACVDAGPCAPQYEAPSFSVVYAKTIAPTCNKSGASCHAAEGKQGGLDFSSEDKAYETLRQRNAFYENDPGCSEIILRLQSTDPYKRMPPGASLSPEEQCAVAKWIANGAKR